MFSPPSRETLKRAVDDCLGISSEGNRPTRLLGPIGKWDVSQVTDMNELFFDRETFNYELSDWDVSRVTEMQQMFTYALSFNQDLSKWDVSRVTDMFSMFVQASEFNRDLSKWDVSRVNDMFGMFAYALSFNQDLSNWDVSRVTDMERMFLHAHSFQQTLCGAAWVNSNATKIDMFLYSLGSISKTVCGLWMFWSFVCSLMLFNFVPHTSTELHLNGHTPIHILIPQHSYYRPAPHMHTFITHIHIHTLLTSMPAFSPQSLDELKRAVDDCQSDRA